MFGYNVKEALGMIEHVCNKIICRGKTYDSLCYHAFDCLKYGKNSDFVVWMKRAEQDISPVCGNAAPPSVELDIAVIKLTLDNNLKQVL